MTYLVTQHTRIVSGHGRRVSSIDNIRRDQVSRRFQSAAAANPRCADDSSMTSISAANGILSFTPKTGAYFYETFPCQALTTDKYTHVQFDIKAPAAGAAMTIELKTAASCTATTSTKVSFRVTGLTGAWQTLRVPLTSFAGANLNAAQSVVLGSFSSTSQWQLDKVAFVCGESSTPSTGEC